MIPLDVDLKTPKESLDSFAEITVRVLNYLPNVLSDKKEKDNIAFTLVSGLFMVYSKFLIELDGIYYLDLPPNALKSPLNKQMKPFSQLILHDIWDVLYPNSSS